MMQQAMLAAFTLCLVLLPLAQANDVSYCGKSLSLHDLLPLCMLTS